MVKLADGVLAPGTLCQVISVADAAREKACKPELSLSLTEPRFDSLDLKKRRFVTSMPATRGVTDRIQGHVQTLAASSN